MPADRENQGAGRAPRKPYTAPRLEKYGHVAKLTQAGGSTKSEPGNPKMKPNCL
jgi:hypothetical protein